MSFMTHLVNVGTGGVVCGARDARVVVVAADVGALPADADLCRTCTRHWLALADLAPLDRCATLSPTPTMATILDAVVAERRSQDGVWGRQDCPAVPPPGSPHALPRLDVAACRDLVRYGFSAGHGSWAAIALEELAEVVEAAEAGDPAETRAELVQLTAVLVAWIEAHDRAHPPAPVVAAPTTTRRNP